jgi:hypothetical protein
MGLPSSRERARRAEEETAQSKQAPRLLSDEGIDLEPPSGSEKPTDTKPSKAARDQAVEPVQIAEGKSWPYPASLHPVTVGLEPASIAELGEAIKNGESEPFARAKAVHDWVADRITYDVAASPARDRRKTPRRCFAVATLCVPATRSCSWPSRRRPASRRDVTGDAKGANGEVDGAGHVERGQLEVPGTCRHPLGTRPRWKPGLHEGPKTDYLFTPRHHARDAPAQ